MKMSKKRGGSLLFLALGIYGIIFSVQLPLGKISNPGAGMFPFYLAILIFISGVLLYFLGKGTPEEQEQLDWNLAKNQVTPLKIVAYTATFILLLVPFGFLVTSILYLMALFLWVSRFKWWISIFFALGIGIGIWLFFGRLLSVQLPKGLLPF